jgi:hypothetical protein
VGPIFIIMSTISSRFLHAQNIHRWKLIRAIWCSTWCMSIWSISPGSKSSFEKSVGESKMMFLVPFTPLSNPGYLDRMSAFMFVFPRI